jgi:hypothetical protein
VPELQKKWGNENVIALGNFYIIIQDIETFQKTLKAFWRRAMSLTSKGSDKSASITKSLKFITWLQSCLPLDKKIQSCAGMSISFLTKISLTLQ